jgi:hypothetical protein
MCPPFDVVLLCAEFSVFLQRGRGVVGADDHVRQHREVEQGRPGKVLHKNSLQL